MAVNWQRLRLLPPAGSGLGNGGQPSGGQQTTGSGAGAPKWTGDEAEDVIEAALEEVLADPASLEAPEAVPALLAAFRATTTPHSLRDLAHLLARAAAPIASQHEIATDALEARYRAARTDWFLGPELLHALAVLGERSALARSVTINAILRLGAQDSRSLLIRAAKIIGTFESLGIDTGAGEKLIEWSDLPDFAVRGEARQQRAILSLTRALRVADLAGLQARLAECRVALLGAEASEELRVDATRLLALLDVLDAYLEARRGGALDTGVLADRARALVALVDDPHQRSWAGQGNPTEAAVEYRLHRVGLGFLRLAGSLGTIDEWTNFDAALLETAAAFRLMWSPEAAQPTVGDGVGRVINALEARVGVRPLGPLFARAVTRTRLARVLANYEARGVAEAGTPDGGDRHPKQEVGDADIAVLLRHFLDAATAAEQTAGPAAEPLDVDVDALARLAADHPVVVAAVCAVIPNVVDRLRAAGLTDIPDGSAIGASGMPMDAPGLYGEDPAVDDTVRPLLAATWAPLGPGFPLSRWSRLREVLVFLVQVARDLRSDLPTFMLAAEDGGLGRTANEEYLQRYLFARLRERYGRSAVYEAGPNSGGRPDSGLQFDELMIPIEVKAEYSNVGREHIRSSYLGQPNQYATDRDRVAVLLILDLRASNAAGHRAVQQRARQESKTPATLLSLYGLRESFWVDALPTDPQVEGARPNAVIVGLMPGNQSRPSSTTRYSRRPRPRLGD